MRKNRRGHAAVHQLRPFCEAIGLPRTELCTACFDGNYLEEEDDQTLLEV
ncbi:MAG: hypothetical protein ACLUEQ_01370 [Cloacibacillus evryensis]